MLLNNVFNNQQNIRRGAKAESLIQIKKKLFCCFKCFNFLLRFSSLLHLCVVNESSESGSESQARVKAGPGVWFPALIRLKPHEPEVFLRSTSHVVHRLLIILVLIYCLQCWAGSRPGLINSLH